MMSKNQSLNLKVSFSIQSNWETFNILERQLLLKAKKAVKAAYAPYSKFKVGASVLLSNNEIITGNNQENATYPNGLCAERVALFNASSNFPNQQIIALALTIDYTNKNIHEPVFPCGSCRQSILEYEERWKGNIKLYVIGPNDEVVIINTVKDILPLAFSGDYLRHSH